MAQVRSMNLVKVTFIFMLSFLVIRSLPIPTQYLSYHNLRVQKKYTWRYSVLLKQPLYRLKVHYIWYQTPACGS